MVQCQPKNEGDNKVTISGSIAQPVDDGWVRLERITDEGLVAVDSAQVKNGKFELNAEVEEPDFYNLNMFDKQQSLLILDGSDVTVTADGNTEEGKFEVSGSPTMDDLAMMDELSGQFVQKQDELNAKYMTARAGGDSAAMEDLRASYETLRQQHDEEIIEAIKKMDGRLSALKVAFDNFAIEDRLPLYEQILADMRRRQPESKHVAMLEEIIQSVARVAVGSQMPPIALPNPQGDTIALSDLQARVVLVDFWAAWCGPCRAANPALVDIYAQYHDDGFEIYGVSLDRNKEAWTKAIAEDNLTWPQVSDLKYFDSPVITTFQIEGIPASFLLNEAGEIIGKDLQPEELRARLQELLGPA